MQPGNSSDRDRDRRGAKRKEPDVPEYDESRSKWQRGGLDDHQNRHPSQHQYSSQHQSQASRPSQHSKQPRSQHPPQSARASRPLDREHKTAARGSGEFLHKKIFQFRTQEEMRRFLASASAEDISAMEISQRIFKLGKCVENEKNRRDSVFPSESEALINFLFKHIRAFVKLKFNAQDAAMLFYGLAHLSERYDFRGDFREIAPDIIDLLAWFKDGSVDPVKGYQSLSMVLDGFVKFMSRTETFSFTTQQRRPTNRGSEVKEQKEPQNFITPLLRLVDRCLDSEGIKTAQPRQLISVLTSIQPILEHGIEINVKAINSCLALLFQKLDKFDRIDQIEAPAFALALHSSNGLSKLRVLDFDPKVLSPLIVQCLVNLCLFRHDKAPKSEFIAMGIYGFGGLVEAGFVQERDSAKIEDSLNHLINLLLEQRFSIGQLAMVLNGWGKILSKRWIRRKDWEEKFQALLATMKTIPSASEISMIFSVLAQAIESKVVSVEVLLKLLPTFRVLGEKFNHTFNSRVLRVLSSSLSTKVLTSETSGFLLELMERWLNPSLFEQKLGAQELALYLLAIGEFAQKGLLLDPKKTVIVIYRLFGALIQPSRQFSLHEIAYILQALSTFAKIELLPPKSDVEQLLNILLQTLQSVRKINRNEYNSFFEIFGHFARFADLGYLAHTQLLDLSTIFFLIQEYQKYLEFSQYEMDPYFSKVMFGVAKLVKIGAVRISKEERHGFDKVVASWCSSRPTLVQVFYMTDALCLLADADMEPIRDKREFTKNITDLFHGLGRLDERDLLEDASLTGLVILNLAKLAENAILVNPDRDFSQTLLKLARLLLSNNTKSKALALLISAISMHLECNTFKSSFLKEIKEVVFQLIMKVLGQDFNAIDVTQILKAIGKLLKSAVSISDLEAGDLKRLIVDVLKPEFCAKLKADDAILILRELNNYPNTFKLEITREVYSQLLKQILSRDALSDMSIEMFLVIAKFSSQHKDLGIIDVGQVIKVFQGHLSKLAEIREWTVENIVTAVNIVTVAKHMLLLGVSSQDIQAAIDTLLLNMEMLLNRSITSQTKYIVENLRSIFVLLGELIYFHELKLSRLNIYINLAEQYLLNIRTLSLSPLHTLQVLTSISRLMEVNVILTDTVSINKAVAYLLETLPDNLEYQKMALIIIGRFAARGVLTKDISKALERTLEDVLTYSARSDTSSADICALINIFALLINSNALELSPKYLRRPLQDLLQKLVINPNPFDTDSLEKLLLALGILSCRGFLDIDHSLLADLHYKVCNELYHASVTTQASLTNLIHLYFWSLGKCLVLANFPFKQLFDASAHFSTLLERFAAGKPDLRQIAGLLDGLADYTNSANGRELDARSLAAKLKLLFPLVPEQMIPDENTGINIVLNALAQLVRNGKLALSPEDITVFINEIIVKIKTKSILFILSCAVLFEHNLLLWNQAEIQKHLQTNIQLVQSEWDHVLMLDTLHKFRELDVTAAANLLKIFRDPSAAAIDRREDKEQAEKAETIANSNRLAFRLHKVLGYCLKVKKMTLEQLGVSDRFLKRLEEIGNSAKKESSVTHDRIHDRLVKMLINSKTDRKYPRYELVQEHYSWGSFIDTAIFYHIGPKECIKIAIEPGASLFHADFKGGQLTKDAGKEELLKADGWIYKSFVFDIAPKSKTEIDEAAKEVYRFILATVQQKTAPSIADRGNLSFGSSLPKVQSGGPQEESKPHKPPVERGMQSAPVYKSA